MRVYKRSYSETSLKDDHIRTRHAVSPTRPIQPEVTASRVECFALGFWLAVSILAFAGGAIHQLNRPIDEGGGPYFGLAARSFVRDGIIALHGVPLLNNPPTGREPDWYIHWPPLFPIIIGVAFRVFGESPATAHALMLAIMVAIAAALYPAVVSCCGRKAGLWAVFAMLALPPSYKFGYYVVTQGLALALIVLSLWGFTVSTRTEPISAGWAWLGALFLCLAVLTSWEGLLMPLGLVAWTAWLGDRKRLTLALRYTAFAGVTLLGVIAFYLWNVPQLAAELAHIGMFRMGFKYGTSAVIGIHSLADRLLYGGTRQPGIGQLLIQYANDVYMLGPPGIVALAGVLTWIFLQRHTLQGRRIGTLILGLLSSWVLWLIFMRNHAYIHPQEVIYAVPGTAAAMGIALASLLESSQTLAPDTRKLMRFLLLGIVPAVLIVGMTREILTLAPFSDAPNFYMHFGMAIGQNTPEGAVVLIPDDSRVPAYYSRRHVVRGVANDSMLESISSRLHTAFPGAPLYLALQNDDVRNFPRALQHERVVAQTTELVLVRLDSNELQR